MRLTARSRPQLDVLRRVRWARLVRLVVRVLAVFACLELSGAMAFAAEIGEVPDAAAEDCCGDCPLEKDGKECPPMCPACHCTHAMLAVPSALAVALTAAAPPFIGSKLVTEQSLAPPMPQPGTLYRPPRTVAGFV
jgi:hypothetical protein